MKLLLKIANFLLISFKAYIPNPKCRNHVPEIIMAPILPGDVPLMYCPNCSTMKGEWK